MANANKNNVVKRGDLSRPLFVSEGDQNFNELINVIEDTDALEISIQERLRGVSSVAELQSLNPVDTEQVTLSGAYSGIFEFDSSNLSTRVSNDSNNRYYIAPLSDTSGLSGAWVRQSQSSMTLERVTRDFYLIPEVEGAIYTANSWSGGLEGTSTWIYQSSVPKTRHDGVLFVSPTVPAIGVGGQTESGFLNGTDEQDPTGSGVFRLLNGTVTRTAVVRIPEDYSSLQQAIDDLANRISTTEPADINVRISGGFSPDSGLLLTDGDYSQFRIVSDDTTVTLSSSFPSSSNIIEGLNAVMPRLAVLFDAVGRGNHGIYVRACRGIVEPNKGVLNAGYFGLYVNEASTYKADSSRFTNAGANNSVSSQVDATGISARRGSKVFATGCDVSNSLRYGLSASKGSTVVCDNTSADNCGRHGIRADEASVVQCAYASARFAGAFGIYALRGSTIHAEGADANGSDRGIYAAFGSFITAENSTASNCTSRGYIASHGSKISASGGEANNVVEGVFSARGSTIDFHGGTSTTGSVGDTNLAVSEGGIINAHLSTYNNLSKTANNITTDGIIFV